jgi:chemotaxis protein methyltransferase CheR
MRVGLDINAESSDLKTRIGRLMMAARTDTIEAYLAVLEDRSQPESWNALLRELTVPESYFFRDVVQFQHLEKTVFPDLFGSLPPDEIVNIWCAGCAAGEEPYSVAILADRLGVLDRVRILATDICEATLERAATAVYRSWSFRDVDPMLIRRYFLPVPTGRRPLEHIRRVVTFRRHNLTDRSGPSGQGTVSLVLCRNVLIYFETTAIPRVGTMLAEQLTPGGWLVTGACDPSLERCSQVEQVVLPGSVFYRRPAAGRPLDASSVTPRRQRISLPRQRPLIPHPIQDPEPRDANQWHEVVQDVCNRLGPESAELEVERALSRHPLSTELRFLKAVLLVSRGAVVEALAEVGRVLYVDDSLAAAHFMKATCLRRSGKTADAVRSYRTALKLLRAVELDVVVPLSDGETAGRLVTMLERELAAI